MSSAPSASTATPPASASGAGVPPGPVPELGHAPVAEPPSAPFDATVARPSAHRPVPAAGPERTPAAMGRPVALVAGVLLVSWWIGRLTGTQGRTLVHNKMLPWILGRGLGVAAFVSLTAMVVLGLWLRHPWRARYRRPAPATILWAHVTLAACTITLVAGHVTSLALDKYAGVGWSGAFVPGEATFKTTGVALGTVALYGLLLVVGTAALAGSIGRRAWFPIHSASVLVFCVTLAHGVMSGSDGTTLRWFYVASGLLVVVLQATRWIVGTLAREPELLAE